MTDGASVVLLASEAWAAQRGLPVLAYLRTGETAAVNFVDGTEGLLMAPAYAVPRMLKREGLSVADIDFSRFTKPLPPRYCAPSRPGRTPMCRERLGLDAPLGSIERSKMNVNGGSSAVVTRLPQPVADNWRHWPRPFTKTAADAA